jgi:hypothetical protein
MPSFTFIVVATIFGRLLWSKSISFKETLTEEFIFFVLLLIMQVIFFSILHYIAGIDFQGL